LCNVNGQLANFKQQKPIEVWALATYDKPKAHLGRASSFFSKTEACRSGLDMSSYMPKLILELSGSSFLLVFVSIIVCYKANMIKGSTKILK
jgi:hypothetical protein